MEVASKSTHLSLSFRSEQDHSLEEVNFNDFYPKKSTIFEREGLKIPFSLVPGEYVVYIGSMSNGIIALSNFRLFVSEQNALLFNIPLGLLDYIESSNLVTMLLLCKDAKTFKCTFSTSEKCSKWMGWVGELMSAATRLPSSFALTFCAWCLSDKIHLDPFFQEPQACFAGGVRGSGVFDRETTRMAFDLTSANKAWRICHANHNYDICDTYPQYHVVPWSITDDMMKDMSKYRSNRRFPSVVWRDTETGLVLVRSSQPSVGVFWWRNSSDESFLKSVGRSCQLNPGRSSPSPLHNGHHGVEFAMTHVSPQASAASAEVTKDLLLIDARSFAAATVNRAKGGGVECDEYYPNVTVIFMSLPNIHAIKKSFSLLRTLSSHPVDEHCWWSSLETSRWFNHMSNLLKSALVVVDSIRVDGRSVMVHCSDGWDRTPQIISLAQLLMDPYYRTIEGFHDLVQREWLEFGHRFSDRCGQGLGGHGDYDNKSPIFLQWLDCIHQVLMQFPCSFQFNMNFLVKMVQHTYSCLFGEFLYNSDNERNKHRQAHKTASIWSFLLNNSRFHNPLYRNTTKALRPLCTTRDMYYWKQVYTSSSHATSSTIEDFNNQSDVCDEDDVTTSGRRVNKLVVDGEVDGLVWDGEMERRKKGEVLERSVGGGLSNGYVKRDENNNHPCHDQNELPKAGSYCNGDNHYSGDESNQIGGDENGRCDKIINNDGVVASHCSDKNECNGDTMSEVNNEDDETFKDYIGDNEDDVEDIFTNDNNYATSLETTFESHTINTKHHDASQDPTHPRMHLHNHNLYNHYLNNNSIKTSNNSIDNNSLINNSYNNTNNFHNNFHNTTNNFHNNFHNTTNNFHNNNTTEESSRRRRSSSASSNFANADNVKMPENLLNTTSLEPPSTSIEPPKNSIEPPTTSIKPPTTSIEPPTSSIEPPTSSIEPPTSSIDHTFKHESNLRSRRDSLSATKTSPILIQHNPLNKHLHHLSSPKLSYDYMHSSRSDYASSSSPRVSRTKPLENIYQPEVARDPRMQHLIDTDGLTILNDPVCRSIIRMRRHHQVKLQKLQRVVEHLRKLIHSDPNSAAMLDGKDDASSEGSSPPSSGGSAVSWELLSESQDRMVLWVPDHHVTHCSACEREFWIALRKHHCRSCGRIFCHDCTSHFIPCPDQDLNVPVRVCRTCFASGRPITLKSHK